MALGKMIFKVFPMIIIMGAKAHWYMASKNPRGMINTSASASI